MLRKYWPYLFLIAITILGFCLRIYRLDFQCLSYDETFTLNLALQGPMEIVYFALNNDCNTPIYYLFAHYSVQIFGGSSNFTIRFPSVIFGTLLIPASYFLAREFYNEWLGALVSFTIAVSFPMIFYADNARSYALVFLVFCLCMFCYLKMRRYDFSYAPYFTVCAGLSLWVHIYSFVPLAFLCILLLIQYRWKMLPYYGLMAFWCIPFTVYLHSQITIKVIETFGLSPERYLLVLPLEIAGLLSLVVLPLFAYAIYRYRENKTLLIFAMLPIYTATVFFILTMRTSIFPRYVLLTVPMLLMVAYYPVVKYLERFEGKKKGVLFVIALYVIAALNFTALIAYYFHYDCVYF